MSTEYAASVFVGIKLSDVLQKREVTRKKKQHDVDSGEPYFIDFKDTTYAINTESFDDMQSVNEYLDGLSLDVVHERETGMSWIGINLGNLNYRNSNKSLDHEEVFDAISRANDKIKANLEYPSDDYSTINSELHIIFRVF
jgi:hypothetical protein